MPNLELATSHIEARTLKKLSIAETLTAGAKLKLELDENELSVIVPEGESWYVHLDLLIKVAK